MRQILVLRVKNLLYCAICNCDDFVIAFLFFAQFVAAKFFFVVSGQRGLRSAGWPRKKPLGM